MAIIATLIRNFFDPKNAEDSSAKAQERILEIEQQRQDALVIVRADEIAEIFASKQSPDFAAMLELEGEFEAELSVDFISNLIQQNPSPTELEALLEKAFNSVAGNVAKNAASTKKQLAKLFEMLAVLEISARQARNPQLQQSLRQLQESVRSLASGGTAQQIEAFLRGDALKATLKQAVSEVARQPEQFAKAAEQMASRLRESQQNLQPQLKLPQPQQRQPEQKIERQNVADPSRLQLAAAATKQPAIDISRILQTGNLVGNLVASATPKTTPEAQVVASKEAIKEVQKEVAREVAKEVPKEQPKIEVAKAEIAKPEAAKTEAPKTEPAKVETAKTEAARGEATPPPTTTRPTSVQSCGQGNCGCHNKIATAQAQTQVQTQTQLTQQSAKVQELVERKLTSEDKVAFDQNVAKSSVKVTQLAKQVEADLGVNL